MRICFFLSAIVIVVCISALSAQTSESTSPLFGLTNLHSIHIIVSPGNFAKMEPPPRPPFGGGPTAGGPNRPAPGSPDFGAGNFGFEFEYVPAKVVINGRKLDNVGLRYKGSGTYMMSARQVKRSLKLDFDRYDEEQTHDGIKKVNLHSGVMDPTKLRDALGYAAFRAAGVPAPRTAFANVELTVPGKYSAEPLGLFTVVEQVDSSFLKDHFGNGKGLLLKPEGIRGLPHFGTDPKAYEPTYIPKDEAREEDWQRLIELTRLINIADVTEFQERIGEYLDLDAFARFVAANAALASLDGFLGLGHNYYLYLAPETNKFVFIPWDLDLAFGAFPVYGRPEQLLDLSIDHPHVGQNKLIDRLLAMPDWKATYREHLKHLSENVLVADELGAKLQAVEAALETSLAKDKSASEARNERAPGGIFGATPVPLATFIEKRKQSIDAQLAGKSKGYVPTQSFGFGNFGPPRGGSTASRLFTALDADRDGKLTEDEIVVGMEKLSREWDADEDRVLDGEEFVEGVGRLRAR